MKQRAMRVAEAIKEEIGNLLLYEIKDPRIAFCSVTDVEVSGDLSKATVYVSIMGSEEERTQSMLGLESCKGVLRRAIGQRLKLRQTPELSIVLDNSIAKGARLLELMKKELP